MFALRPDPAQRARLDDIRDNLEARIIEAKGEGWLGEVEGLQVSYSGVKDKLAQLDATLAAGPPGRSSLACRHSPPSPEGSLPHESSRDAGAKNPVALDQGPPPTPDMPPNLRIPTITRLQ